MNPKENELPTPLEVPASERGTVDESLSQKEQVKQLGTERNPELMSQIVGGQGLSSPQNNAPQVAKPIAPTSDSSKVGDHHASQLSGSSPAIADDVDLIEKEWVEKAKEIVEKTRENPYLQNKALSEIKADYIKKRYNKELAKSEE